MVVLSVRQERKWRNCERDEKALAEEHVNMYLHAGDLGEHLVVHRMAFWVNDTFK